MGRRPGPGLNPQEGGNVAQASAPMGTLAPQGGEEVTAFSIYIAGPLTGCSRRWLRLAELGKNS
jgi:hypothetical protein